jgi:hypothetical protein
MVAFGSCARHHIGLATVIQRAQPCTDRMRGTGGPNSFLNRLIGINCLIGALHGPVTRP